MTDPTRLVEGKVAIITGAGRGLGREHALLLADHGAKILVNDLGAAGDGRGVDAGPAHEVAALIRDKGGEALVNGSDVADFGAAGEMVQQAIDAWGQVDILVNNAGFLRDRMIFSMEEDDWDAIINVHLKGHFCPTRHVTAHWRARSRRARRTSARASSTPPRRQGCTATSASPTTAQPRPASPRSPRCGPSSWLAWGSPSTAWRRPR